MARIDKYDPVDGGFRAPLAADRDGDDDPIGVGLNSSGRVVAGAGNTGIIAVLCKPDDAVALSIVDCMTDGEIVEFGGTAGTTYYADTTTGVIGSSGGVGKVRVGHTVEATRLVVRLDRGADTAATAVVGDQAAIADVATADADATYGQPEADLINEVKTKFNTLLAELRTAGVIAP